MKKLLPLFAGLSLLASCGGGGGGGLDGVGDVFIPGPGDIPIPDIPSNVTLTSFEISPLNGTVYPGDTITVSASWQINGITPVETKVKVYFASPPYYFPDIHAARFFFTCDDGGACNGSFTINCVREPDTDTYSAYLRCTLPDGTEATSYVALGSRPNNSCVLLYLETTDTQGRIHFAFYPDTDKCLTFY